MLSEVSWTRFTSTIEMVTMEEHERFNIGTYQEKKLHLFMKNYLEPDTTLQEVPYAGHIADIKRGNEIIEIETSGFSGLKKKLAAYLPECKVTLVYPIATYRYISWIDPDSGDITPRHRSPKKENVYDLLFQGVYIMDYLSHPNLTIAGMCMELQEYRMLDGWSRDRKRGSHRYECMPTALYDILSLRTLADYAAQLPECCQKDFTCADFYHAIGKNQRMGYAILRVYQKLGLVEQKGKSGRRLLYSRTALAEQSMEGAKTDASN